MKFLEKNLVFKAKRLMRRPRSRISSQALTSHYRRNSNKFRTQNWNMEETELFSSTGVNYDIREEKKKAKTINERLGVKRHCCSGYVMRTRLRTQRNEKCGVFRSLTLER
jgi:DNA-directed RNA polymerase subunit N (RpoN/RPB10)